MKKILFSFTIITLLNACAIIPDPVNMPGEPLQLTITLTEPPIDSDKLFKALHNQSEQVGVLLGKSIDPDNEMLLDELNKWITAIEENGGKAYYEPWNSPQGLLPINLVVFSLQIPNLAKQQWYKEYKKQKQKYNPAKNYDARLCYRRDDNLVTKIVFIERSQSDKQVCYR